MGALAVAIKHLMAAGVTGDALVTAIADIEDAMTPKRSAAAERQARYRERKKASLDVTCDAKKEIPPTPPKEKINNIPTNARAREAEEIFTELCAVLPKELARDVIQHRKKLKKPLSVRAAKGLASRFAKCRDGPEAAAEAMIVNGWQGFEPEWVENAKRASNNGNHPAGTMDGLRQLLDQAEDFDRRGRESAGSDGEETGRRQIGAG